MLGKWLKSHMSDRAFAAGQKELVHFISGLRSMEDHQIGALIAVATVLRINFESHDVIPKGVFTDGELPSAETLGKYQQHINKLIRQFKRMRQPDDVSGAMLWSYSLRALNVPGLRPLGQEIWQELSRGLPHVEEALKDGEEQRGEAFSARVWAEWSMIPAGLEPMRNDSVE